MDEVTTPENINAVANETSQTTPVLPGKMLREARERLGLSVADVAQHTRLAPRQIEALEADDFDHLPELPFVRGFIRSYARLLQIDPEPLLAVLPPEGHSSVPLMPPSVEAPFPSPFMMQRRNLMVVGATLLLVLLGGLLAVWNFMSPAPVTQNETAPPAVQNVLPPDQDQPASAVSETVAPVAPDAAVLPESVPVGKLHLKMSEKTWVEIRDRAGNVLLSQNNPAGSDVQIEGMAPLSLVLGQTRGAQLIFNGRPVALPPTVDPKSGVARLTLE
ncbi:MAG: DUF4115 domain-containing protein [Gallionella sp.]|nr:DUF4115 domain-containing protein [Gallionella sp.]